MRALPYTLSGDGTAFNTRIFVNGAAPVKLVLDGLIINTSTVGAAGIHFANTAARTITLEPGTTSSITANREAIFSSYVSNLPDLTISGGGALNAHGRYRGIAAAERLIIQGESEIFASGYNNGIWAHAYVTIEGGTVTAETTGIGPILDHAAITASTGDIVITGGTVKATGKAAFPGSPDLTTASFNAEPLDAPGGNPLHQLVIPTNGNVRTVHVNGQSWYIPANHPGDNNLYLWVPAGITAADVVINRILPVPKTGDAFPLTELAVLASLAAAGGMVLLARGRKSKAQAE